MKKLTSHQIMTRAAGLAAVLLGGLVLTGCGCKYHKLQPQAFTPDSAKTVQRTDLRTAMPYYTYANPHTKYLWGSDGFNIESDTGSNSIDNQNSSFILYRHQIRIPANIHYNSWSTRKLGPNGSDNHSSDYVPNSDNSAQHHSSVHYALTPKTLTLYDPSVPSDQPKHILTFAKYKLHMIKHTKGRNLKYPNEIEFILYPLEYKRNNSKGMQKISQKDRARYELRLIRNKSLNCSMSKIAHHVPYKSHRLTQNGQLPS